MARKRKTTAAVTDEAHMALEKQVYINATNIAHLQKNVQEIHADVKALLTTVDKAKGGWRALLIMIGTSSAIGAVVAKLVPFIKP